MKRILITGCSSGIGEASALRLAAAGHRVYATIRRAEDARRLEGAGAGLRGLAMDVTDDASVRGAVRAVEADGGAPDVLVNNVGIPCLGSMEELQLADLREAMEANVYGALRVYQAVVPGMRRRGSGHIVNLSSSIGAAALPLYGGYCATKFALEAMSEAMWYELAPFGIAVNVLRPGIVSTPFGVKKREQAPARIPPDSPYAGRLDTPSAPDLMARISTAEQVADALVALIENPGAPFRRSCGEDSRGWLAARRTMDDETFYRTAILNGYGSV
jgi:NAD(P)-dependent dehydrogenase (short-subunit alcohol dehydrogenase family)